MLIVLKPVLTLNGSEAEEFEGAVSHQTDFAVADWLRRDMPHRQVFAAYRSGRFVGMCCWSGMPDRVQACVWVVPHERRQGCGSAMTDALAEEMKGVRVTAIAPMPIAASGREAETAKRLAGRLRSHLCRTQPRPEWRPSIAPNR